MFTKRNFLHSAALATLTATMTKPFPVRAQTSADRPGFLKSRDIAEAGFIYGLPIVMNYGVMYEYAVDRTSGQFKAPFNQLKNKPNATHHFGNEHSPIDRHPGQQSCHYQYWRYLHRPRRHRDRQP